MVEASWTKPGTQICFVGGWSFSMFHQSANTPIFKERLIFLKLCKSTHPWYPITGCLSHWPPLEEKHWKWCHEGHSDGTSSLNCSDRVDWGRHKQRLHVEGPWRTKVAVVMEQQPHQTDDVKYHIYFVSVFHRRLLWVKYETDALILYFLQLYRRFPFQVFHEFFLEEKHIHYLAGCRQEHVQWLQRWSEMWSVLQYYSAAWRKKLGKNWT